MISDDDGLREEFWLVPLKLFFDVAMAKRIVGAPYAKPDKSIPISAAKKGLYKTDINRSHVKSTNLKSPIIIGTVGEFHFVIDGHHRLTKAVGQKRRMIPAYILTLEETKSCANPKLLFDKLNRGLPVPIGARGSFR